MSTLGTFWGPFSQEISILCEKKDAENRYEKSARPGGSRGSMILSRGSLTAPLACALFQQEKIVRAQISGIVARTRFFFSELCFILFPFQNF
jgi:hypothetical protein